MESGPGIVVGHGVIIALPVPSKQVGLIPATEGIGLREPIVSRGKCAIPIDHMGC
jgi:hypothetical protein